MDEQELKIDDFIATILRNLEKNGFPTNAVSFGLETMFESASKRGFSFNKVRERLQVKGIATELTTQHVIFSAQEAPAADFDLSNMAETAQQILQQMSSEQRSQVERMMRDMQPEDLENIKRQWESMPTGEKARMMDEVQKTNPES